MNGVEHKTINTAPMANNKQPYLSLQSVKTEKKNKYIKNRFTIKMQVRRRDQIRVDEEDQHLDLHRL